MDRRTLLGTIGATGIVGLTGCLSGDGSGETPSAAGTATTTSTPTPAPDPTLTDATFTVVGRQSGTQSDSASVSVDGESVVVEGSIWGRDGCQTAELRSVNYDHTASELTIAIGTTERTDAGDSCTQAVVEIDYTAMISVENGSPTTVVVTHDRGDGPETVVTASP